ncbi:MAG TPA: hypothetical protein VH019_00355, partial [Rhizomicrobium sp.]|nr:hypothetical protein [Rhizomicrobium sp.]
VGSSLVVYPAAGFPELAKQNGATLVIINRDPTGLDAIADLVVNRLIGDTLGAAVVGVDGPTASRAKVGLSVTNQGPSR